MQKEVDFNIIVIKNRKYEYPAIVDGLKIMTQPYYGAIQVI